MDVQQFMGPRFVARFALAIVVALGASTLACAGLLGVDEGIAADAGTEDDSSAADASPGDDAAGESGDANAIDVTDADAGHCPSGQIACNGACIPSDAKHCGSCDHDCTALPHVAGVATCQGATCIVPTASCATGWAHCSSNPDDGCETNIRTPAHCGACGTSCSGSTPVCAANGSAWTCVSGCSDGGAQTLCAGSCVDTQSDPTNCGACGHACSGGKICIGGSCQCASGTHDCGGTCVSDVSTGSCGSSCVACPAPQNGTATCANGACGYSCNSGYCAVGSACTSWLTDNAHCGSSCAACPSMETCQGGACICQSPNKLCGNSCVDVASDHANCGSCGHDCLGGQCAQGVCQQVTLVNAGSGNGNYGIAVDSGYAYYTTGRSGGVLRCGLLGCGGAPTTVYSGLGYTTSIHMDSSGSLFVMDGGNPTVLSLNLGSIPATANFSIATCCVPGGLTTDGSQVYWGWSTGIQQAKKVNGTGVQTTGTVSGVVSSVWFDASSNRVFGAVESSPGYIVSCPAGTPGSCTSLQVGANPTDVVVSGNDVFFTAQGTSPTYADGGLFVAKADLSSPAQALATGASYGYALAITADQTNVYFAAQKFNGTVYRCAQSGCGGVPTKIGSAANTVTAITNDAVAVYWVSTDNGLYKVAK